MMRVLVIILLMAEMLPAQPLPAVRKAITAALPMLQTSAGEFVSKRSCVSCHHNILPILTLDLAQRRGFEIDTKVLRNVEEKTFKDLRSPTALDDAIQVSTLNDPTPNDSYLLVAASDAGIAPDLTTAVYARRLVLWQRDGHWITSDFRPPHSSSFFMTTATAVRAIRTYMPEELGSERDAAIRSARKWLSKHRPASTEDAAFRLLGLVWADGSRNEIAAAQRDLLAIQKSNGGWAQIPAYDADAYSTGQALFALRESGLTVTNVSWAKGAQFLISTQAADGTWRVRTRMLSPADISPMYFATGFPYEKDEFISYAGTCWAVMGLLSALPDSSSPAAPVDSRAVAATDAPAWMRTALFGTAAQLTALLDSGLDPNGQSKNGTTLLMAAIPDLQKVQLLASRGAKVKTRGRSGADALTIAAAYRGTMSSIRALLDAGAEVDPPDGVRVRNAPLVLASMSGDLANVKLLLERGAEASEKALAEAVTFGYPDVVRTLIQAGADPNLVEGSGVNLLHWATIANRAEVIRVLAAAHVEINATDENGFTPLMYAATIDFGNTDALKALLSAGADKSIPDREGRTPLAQAKQLGHSALERALR